MNYTKHFREELTSDDLSMEDVLRVCKSGAIVMWPEQDIKTGDWKYRIEGPTVDGRQIAIVFCLPRPEVAVFITVFERTS